MAGSIVDASIRVKPCAALLDLIVQLDDDDDVTEGIRRIRQTKSKVSSGRGQLPSEVRQRDSRRRLLHCRVEDAAASAAADEPCLQLEDLRWLHAKIRQLRESGRRELYLHELLQGSVLYLPENKVEERSPELEERCRQLRAQQESQRYQTMVRNVSGRVRYPADSIAKQIKLINNQLLAIVQFILSVLAGFAFGFIGLQLLVGELDFGFRLLMGIMCSLIIAVAELYFLAKKLNEQDRDDRDGTYYNNPGGDRPHND